MTFKEFYYYSLRIEAEEEREWLRQASMMSLHANMSGSKKRYTPADFNPFADKHKNAQTPKNKEKVIDLKERILARQKATLKN